MTRLALALQMVAAHLCGFAAAPAVHSLVPPEGWKAELVAAAPVLRHPSVVCTAPDGRVFVAEDPMDITAEPHGREGRILCLHPDGRITVFADELHAVFGMQYLEGKLYALHNPKFSVFHDDNGVGRDAVQLIESTLPEPWGLGWNDHVPANFRLAMDGFFYLAVGDKGLYGATGTDGRRVDLQGGGVVRIRPDGTGLEVFSTGVRNILDVALTDEDEVFTYDNTDEHNWMGRLTHMVDGGFYGYPFEFVPRRRHTLWMLADFGGGAATGAMVYNEDALPAEFRGNLWFGDFGKGQVLRVVLARAGGTFTSVRHEEWFKSKPQDFRPVGIAWAADGLSFYVCDWAHADSRENVTVGKLWKISWQGKSDAVPKPEWYLPLALGRKAAPSAGDLQRALAHPSRAVRLTAQRQFARSGDEAVPPLTVLLADPQQPARAKWHAIWALDAIDGGKSAREAILAAGGGADGSVARQALRQCGTRRVAAAVPLLTEKLNDADATLRFQAATALGRIAEPVAAPQLLDALDERDEWTRYAAWSALNRLGRAAPEAWPRIVAGLESANERIREGTTFALRETYAEPLVSALVGLAGGIDRPVFARASAIDLLAGLFKKIPAWRGEWWAYHPALTQPPAQTNRWTGTDSIEKAIAAALVDRSLAVQRAAAQAVQITGDPVFASTVRRAFAEDAGTMAGRELIGAMGALKDVEAVPLLITLLEQREPHPLLDVAIIVAGRIGDTRAAPALLSVARSTAALNLRIDAINALAALRASGTAAALGELARGSAPDVQAAALRALGALGGHEAFVELRDLRGAAIQPRARRQWIAAVAQTRDPDAAPLLLEEWRVDETRSAAFAALAQLSDLRALDVYLEGLSSTSAATRELSRTALQPLRDAALPLLEQRVAHLQPAQRVELRLIYREHPALVESALFKGGQADEGLPAYAKYATDNPGDPWLGQQRFFDTEGASCITCHPVAGHGRAIGPELTMIGAQFSRRELIESILFPSKVVREGYQQIVIELTGGETISGALKGETADLVTLADALGELHHVAKSSIVSRENSALSLMPEGLQTGLSPNQFADLVAYCESRKTDPRKPPFPLNAPNGFEPLFNGRDLSGWGPIAAKPHWQVQDGAIEHDGVAEDLWSEREFGDFVLRLQWRWPDAPGFVEFPLIGEDGSELKGADGQPQVECVLDAGDSGVFLRGFRKAQANLFCYPIGSGEVREYRTDPSLPPPVRSAVTPRRRADRPLGDWNDMEITLRGDRLTVRLNDQLIIEHAQLPGLPARGPIGFQHEHGRIQFRNIAVQELR